MAKGKKTGGRIKGSINKDVLPLESKAREMGIDPFEVLLHFVNGDHHALGEPDKPITLDQRLRAASEACQYLYAKRSTVAQSISAQDGVGFRIVVEDYSKKEGS